MGITKENKVLKQLMPSRVQLQTPIATDMFIPNHSGVSNKLNTKKLIGNEIIKVDVAIDHRSFLNFNYVREFEGINPVIPLGSWDSAGIREPSNIFIESHHRSDKFKVLYSGNGPTLGIGYAYSNDGKTWTKYGTGPVIEGSYQDPYIVLKDGVYYVYLENNGTNDIDLFTSTDFINWNRTTGVLVRGALAWEATLVGSPIVFIENNQWIMLYEGIGTTDGEFGKATSSDGITWTKYASNPIYSPSDTGWASWIVTDDIMKIDGVYYCLYHGGAFDGFARAGIAISSDLINWKDYVGTFIDFQDCNDHIVDPHWFFNGESYLMMYANNDGDGLYLGYPTIKTDFNRVPGTNQEHIRTTRPLNIYGASRQLNLFETDNSNKQYHVQVQNGDFQITETGVADRLTIADTTGATTIGGTINATGYLVGASTGVSGTFTTVDLKTVTVTNGIITSIV